jgi:hypothetical protein
MTPKKEKNTLSDRDGSIRYSACMTLQVELMKNSDPDDAINDSYDKTHCVFCDRDLTEPKIKTAVDHLIPLIRDKKPTPFKIESPMNKVRCCHQCNGSKGKKDAITWMREQHFSEERIRFVEERISSVPKFSEKEYDDLTKKFDIMMKTFETTSDFGEDSKSVTEVDWMKMHLLKISQSKSDSEKSILKRELRKMIRDL